MVYFFWADTPIAGAQCSHCHTILWTNLRTHPILSESVPAQVATHHGEYRRYYEGKIARFLSSMPPCPHCGKRQFDRFINNTQFPRFPSGRDIPEGITSADLIKVDPDSTLVYYVTVDSA